MNLVEVSNYQEFKEKFFVTEEFIKEHALIVSAWEACKVTLTLKPFSECEVSESLVMAHDFPDEVKAEVLHCNAMLKACKANKEMESLLTKGIQDQLGKH
jgi:hypothetical protein